jgi:hypothetical protein
MSEFEDLKAGDEVVLISRVFGDTQYSLKKVERVTKTQIVIDNTKYRRSDGWEISRHWNRDNIELPTPEMLQKVEKYNQSVLRWNLMKDLQKIGWGQFSLEHLREIKNFINERQQDTAPTEA